MSEDRGVSVAEKLLLGLNLEFLTKVLPPRRRPDILRRQRLVDFLHEHVTLKVQTITAAAGYGKTTLLADFAGDIDIPVCWYYLDASDQDPRVFLDTLVTAIRYRFPNFGQRTEAALRGSSDIVREASRIIGVLTGEMYADIPELFILVLEDYHAIEPDSAVKSVLDLLLERTPANCHFMISSRTPIKLAALDKLGVRRETANLGGKDLSFTPLEIRQLLTDQYQIQLSEFEAHKLAKATEGWVTGVLLGLSASFEGRLPRPGAGLSPQNVFDYLASEVYEKQPPEIKDFLLLSGTLWEMEPQCCDRLLELENSERLLQEIERRNLFVSRLEGQRTLYRYHNLFREFLQAKLRKEQPQTYTTLHGRASSIFEDQGQWHQAIDHYLLAGAHLDAIRIIKKVGESFLKAGRWQTVSRWIQALPERLRAGEPTLTLFEAESLIHLGQVDKAIQLLNRLLNELDATQDWLLVSKALSLRGAAFRLTGYLDEALADITKVTRIVRRNGGPAQVLGDAYRRSGNIYTEQGRLVQAEKSLKRSLKLVLSIFDVSQIADVHNSLGIVYRRMGHLPKAAAHYEEARQYWEKANDIGRLALTLNNMGVLYRYQGQYELALNTLNAGLEKARLTGYQRTEAGVLINLGDVRRDLGLYADAMSSYSQALELARQSLESSQVAIATAGIGECYRLLGELGKAEVLLKEALAQAQEHGQMYDANLFTLQLGIIQCQKSNYKAAQELLLCAHDVAQQAGDKETAAKCALHLAQVAYLSHHNQIATNWLRKVSELVAEIGYEEFLVVEGVGIPALLRYAASRRIGGELFTHVLDKVRERSNLSGTITGPVEQPSSTLEVPPSLKACALGETRVLLNSRPVTDSQWRSAKAKEMFFYLLCESRPASKEQIVASLWPDVSSAKGNSLFHSNLYRLRRALFDTIVLNQTGHYAISPDVPVWFDVKEFESHSTEARKQPSSSQHRVVHLEQAIELYRGPFLSDLYSDWVENTRRRLEDRYLEVLSSLTLYYWRGGKQDRAIELLEKSLTIDPYQEQTYYQLARCYLENGDKASALRMCQRYSKVVTEELGSEPSHQMRRLLHSVSSLEQVATS